MPPDGFVHALQENPIKTILDSLGGLACIIGAWLFAAGIAVSIWPTDGWIMGTSGLVLLVIGIGWIMARSEK